VVRRNTMSEKLIIKNRTELPMKEVLSYVKAIVEKGEVTLAEIEKIIKLLNEIKKNLLDSIFKKIGGNQEEDYED